MSYTANPDRYESMIYRRVGKSGLKLPAISLGLWQNFGSLEIFENSRNILLRAFDMGITHFDLANNYGPNPGTAEETMGKVLQSDLKNHRDELIISTKAGYHMWKGPYGEFGSRKHLLASLDQSLKRMQLDYVDIFYSHRPDYETPLEETMGALASAVQQGKALYVGISNYNADYSRKAIALLEQMNIPCLIHQASYSIFERWVEADLLDLLHEKQVGLIAFSPLAQGLLTNRYLTDIPKGSRMNKEHGTLSTQNLSQQTLKKIRLLNDLALARGQSLSEMAIAWLLKDPRVCSVLVGVSSVDQLTQNCASLQQTAFTSGEMEAIQRIVDPQE